MDWIRYCILYGDLKYFNEHLAGKQNGVGDDRLCNVLAGKEDGAKFKYLEKGSTSFHAFWLKEFLHSSCDILFSLFANLKCVIKIAIYKEIFHFA